MSKDRFVQGPSLDWSSLDWSYGKVVNWVWYNKEKNKLVFRKGYNNKRLPQ
ncbi:hypothetical protein KJ973_03000 [Patescibacteria group bacterium]|nr:hypothetical protein [Patescibacteria group bacterium]